MKSGIGKYAREKFTEEALRFYKPLISYDEAKPS